jgi:hypothetical protein
MSDRSAEQHSFELPQQPEIQETTPVDTGEQLVHSPEQTGNQPGTAAPVLAPPPPAAPTQLQPTPISAEPTNIVVKSAPTADDGMAAADGDLIEKEWVDKAKAIVSKTQDDPFIQKNEISRVKAEYIQKRFNKTLPAQETGV